MNLPVEPGDEDPAAMHRGRGLACLAAGDVANALASFRSALTLDPSLADAWVGLGIAYERLGDARSAMTAWDRAVGVQPSLSEAWFRSGALAFTLGRTDDAIARFRRADEAAPTSRFGRLGSARALLSMNLDRDAERVLREAVAADPGNAAAHDLLGHLLADWGRFDEARACFERAVALDGQWVGSWYDLVRCRRVTNDGQELLARMEKARPS